MFSKSNYQNSIKTKPCRKGDESRGPRGFKPGNGAAPLTNMMQKGKSLNGGKVLEDGLQLEVVEDDCLARVGDDAAHDGGEKVGVSRVLHVALVLVQPVLEQTRKK